MNYVVSGTDDFLIESTVNQLLEDEGKDQADVEVFDGKTMEVNMEIIMEAVSTLSLFSPRKIVVVYNPLFLNTKDEAMAKRLEQYYTHPDYDVSLIFVFKDGIDQRKTMVKTVLKYANNIKLGPMDDIEKNKMVATILHDHSIHLTAPLKQALVERLPNDGYTIKQELEKLCLYGPVHSVKEINDLICHPLESSAFSLSNAIASRDFAKAISIYRDLVRQGNQPVALVALLATYFRFLDQVLVYRNQDMDDQTIADILHVKKGRIFYASAILNHLTLKRADTVLSLLAELDQSIKQGRIDANFGFEVMLLKLKEAFL